MGKFFPEPRKNGSGRGTSKDDGSSEGRDRGSKGGDPEADISSWQIAYEFAGIVGVDPRSLTLRKLFWMVEAKERSEWDKYAALIVEVHNVHQISESGLVGFREVHPFYREQRATGRQPTEEELSFAKMAVKEIGRGKRR